MIYNDKPNKRECEKFMPQPLPDVNFINEFYDNHSFRKTTDPFLLNRLDKAICALEAQDPMVGYAQRARYLNYINQYGKAIAHIKEGIKIFGYIEYLAKAEVIVTADIQDFMAIKQTFERFILTFDDNKEVVRDYMYLCQFYCLYDNEVISIADKLGIAERLYSSIDRIKNYCDELDISIDTFRSVITIAQTTLNNYFSHDFNLQVRFNDVIQLFYNQSGWTDEDIVFLNEKINEAILAIDNIDFQVEADEIEVICTNIDPKQIPNSYRLYEDDDNDLIKIISSRMTQNPSPNLEVLDV